MIDAYNHKIFNLTRWVSPLFFAVLSTAPAWASCDRYNYANEFVVSNFQLVNESIIDIDLVELEISADIQNTDEAELDNTVAAPDFTATALDVQLDESYYRTLDFGLVQPLASVSSSSADSNLILRLPPDQRDALLLELNNGSLPMIVTGDETLVLRPDVFAFAWMDTADLEYAGDDEIDLDIYQVFQSSDVFQDATALANLRWTFEENPGLGEPSHCVGRPYPGQQYYVYENATSGPVDQMGMMSGLWFPTELRHGRLKKVAFSVAGTQTDAECASNYADTNLLVLETLNPRTWDIQGAIERGTFCSGESAYLDQPVAQTRFIVPNATTEQPLDAEPGADNPQNLEKDVQPIRINNLQLGDLRVNGQVQGYALKPTMTLRLHPEGVEVHASIESDLSMAVQVTADADISALDFSAVSLGELCFPLPPLPVGFAVLHSSLELRHSLDVSAQMRAGVTMGIEKQFKGGYLMGWDPSRVPGDEFYSDSFHTERPLALTPPRLTDDTAANARIAANFQATLRLGDEACFFAGPFIRATLAAEMQAAPVDNPWWTLSHDGSISAGLTFDLFGINLVEQSAPLVLFPGSESLSAPAAKTYANGGTLIPPGEDQRWAVNVQDLTSPGGKIWVTDVAATADGGAVAITSNGSSGGHERLLRFNASGQLQWDLQYAGIVTHVTDVEVRGDGNILVAGNETGATGFWLALHDPNGNELWNRNIAVSNADGDVCELASMGTFTTLTGEQGIIVAGTSGSTTDQTARACVLRLDQDGNPLWSRVAGDLLDPGTGDGAEWVLDDIMHTRDGGFLLVGYIHFLPVGDFGSTKPAVVKTDSSGNVEWQSLFAIPSEHARIGRFRAVDQADSGEFYLTGSAGGTVNETGGMLVAILSEDGTDGKGAILYYAKFNQGSDTDLNDDPNHWTNVYDLAASANDTGLDIVATDGGAVLVGQLGVKDETWVIRVNEHLGVEWFNSYDGIFQDSLTSISPTPTGLIAAGISQSVVKNSALMGLAGKGTLMVMKIPFEGLVNDFHPSLDIYRRYVLPTVFQGPDYYDNSPMIRVESTAQTLPLVAGIIEDHGSNPVLLQSPSAICASVLTTYSGVASAAYMCDVDSDGLDDIVDNCPAIANPDQLDLDSDGEGDACDDDLEGDGVPNDVDNCTAVDNPDQHDSNGDGFGNICDPDLDNNGVVNFIDYALITSAFLATPSSPNWNADADLNNDGVVNFGDISIFPPYFLGTPGPSGIAP